MTTSGRPGRRRSIRARELDGVLRQIAIEQIATIGWDATTARTVTTAAGVTIGAFYARFVSKAEMARHLWEEGLAERLLGGLGQVVEVAHDPQALRATLEPFRSGSTDLLAGLDVLFASQWEEPLRQAIGEPAAEVFASWFDAEVHGPVEAAIRVAAAGLALGLLIRSDRPWMGSIDLTMEVERHAAVFADPAGPIALDAAVDEGAPLRVRQFAEADESLAALMMAMVETVAAMGYRRATLQQVCSSIGMTTGYLFARFDSKLALMVAAIEATWGQSVVQSQALALELSRRYELGIVEAALWREFLHPELGDLRRFAVEVERLARTEPSLMAAIIARETEAAQQLTGASSPASAPANFETGMALGIGLPALALFDPSIWLLPFSALTVPLMATEPEVDGGLWVERIGHGGLDPDGSAS